MGLTAQWFPVSVLKKKFGTTFAVLWSYHPPFLSLQSEVKGVGAERSYITEPAAMFTGLWGYIQLCFNSTGQLYICHVQSENPWIRDCNFVVVFVWFLQRRLLTMLSHAQSFISIFLAEIRLWKVRSAEELSPWHLSFTSSNSPWNSSALTAIALPA